tara:strand:- start:1946 stop:3124 length:1179 start_codon:yes stop_codon:yes gene_type:complete
MRKLALALSLVAYLLLWINFRAGQLISVVLVYGPTLLLAIPIALAAQRLCGEEPNVLALLHAHTLPTFAVVAALSMAYAVLYWDILAPNALADGLSAEGLTVVITGANSGIGLASAQALRGIGATVVLGCRSHKRCEAAAAAVNAAGIAGPPAVAVSGLELTSLKESRRWARRVRGMTSGAARRGRLILVCNAGMASQETNLKTADGLQLMSGSMYLAHVAIHEVLRPERVVHSGSDTYHLCSWWMTPLLGSCLPDGFLRRGGAVHSGSDIVDYPRSKLLLMLHAHSVARRGGRAYTVSYPWVQTNIQPFMQAVDWSKLGTMASADAAVAPLLFAVAASPAALDARGPNGGIFIPGIFRLLDPLFAPGFVGANTSALADELWADTSALLARL